MTFNSSFFDSMYPEELGKIKARCRLFVSAQVGCSGGLTEDEWKTKAKGDPELSYYVELLGGPEILEHFAYTVWFIIRKQY